MAWRLNDSQIPSPSVPFWISMIIIMVMVLTPPVSSWGIFLSFLMAGSYLCMSLTSFHLCHLQSRFNAALQEHFWFIKDGCQLFDNLKVSKLHMAPGFCSKKNSNMGHRVKKSLNIWITLIFWYLFHFHYGGIEMSEKYNTLSGHFSNFVQPFSLQIILLAWQIWLNGWIEFLIIYIIFRWYITFTYTFSFDIYIIIS